MYAFCDSVFNLLQKHNYIHTLTVVSRCINLYNS